MMHAQCAALARALDEVTDTQAELRKITSRSDERRRHDLVVQRRVLAVQTARLGELGSALFEALGDPVALADYRRLFSAARSRAAAHQADWSAVNVGASDEGYRRSAAETGEAYFLLIDWMRKTIARIVAP